MSFSPWGGAVGGTALEYPVSPQPHQLLIELAGNWNPFILYASVFGIAGFQAVLEVDIIHTGSSAGMGRAGRGAQPLPGAKAQAGTKGGDQCIK